MEHVWLLVKYGFFISSVMTIFLLAILSAGKKADLFNESQ